jgi:DNA processing protein
MPPKESKRQNDLIHKIALTLVPGAGDVRIRRLVAYLGSIENLYQSKPDTLARIPGMGEVLSKQIYHGLRNKEILKRSEKEIAFIEKYKLNVHFFLDETYPYRLQQCEDAPLLFFSLGETPLSKPKMVAIVGTRAPSSQGKNLTRKIVEELAAADKDTTIVSGLAYGIDITAHKAALDAGLDTIAVLAHGMDTLYPASHKTIAQEIIKQGCLITEFMSEQGPEKPNFVKRNRIVAGLSDAVIVVEAGLRSGALITADIANSYNREVFAIPGRVSDPKSAGPNFLIKSNRAALAESAADVLRFMNWSQTPEKKPVQTQLFDTFTEDEKKVYNVLLTQGDCPVDIISRNTGFAPGKLSTILLNLEFQGSIECLPGKVYKLTR